MQKLRLPVLLLLLLALSTTADAQRRKKKQNTTTTENKLFSKETFAGVGFRNIGPAFMSGRIADIAIHPQHNATWYVAVGSGGVWKTENAGTTWQPIFDNQSVYSTGCITIDPNNPHTIWLGTGENVGGRHVGYGDGVYRSKDDGKTWEHMGLKRSEHISKIIVHPNNPNIVWAAAQGPLWSKGGERGVYKTTDGGKNWKQVLSPNEWTGATELLIDPRNPKRLYAATWQRHRTVAAYMGNGAGSGIYISEDGGDNWTKLKNGLPKSNMGKIGLAISPQKPDVLYAAIELDRRKGAVYRSVNRGASWTKMSDAVSGATGPHYYQELYASPHVFDRIYLVDVRMQISENGGKTFRRMTEKHKHSDNHSINFKTDDPNYLLVGTDGGIYESYDLGKNWRYIDNLPITQYYKVAVDDSKPFYNIYGGTQDNNTQGGPSQTDNVHGIRNADWYITLYADGHQPATIPGKPEIIYSEWQEGNLVRVDRTTGEVIHIQPQPEKGEDYERYNWDAPVLVSQHKQSRLYYASQRVWKSEDYGDSWTPISDDLTKNEDRMKMPIMGQKFGWNAGWDFYAMSNYNTITSLAESPKNEELIYAGTDDGLLQVTEDGGANWRKISVTAMSGVPTTAFVNDIKADLHNENTVYVSLDNHKYGDFKPYIYKSTNRGKSWTNISGNLPQGMVWRLVQDHKKPELLFAGTEFGVYFTIDGGKQWTKITKGIPTISVRDLAIQRDEDDLVAASFGRGFFILDDYSYLRDISKDQLKKEASFWTPQQTWWYMPRPVLGYSEKGAQGASHYVAPNPPFGAVFTYYLSEGYVDKVSLRKKTEQEKLKKSQLVDFPEWEELEKELSADKPQVWISITDGEKNVVRRIKSSSKKGFHRVAWDLRYPPSQPIKAKAPNPKRKSKGMLAAPGKYFAQLWKTIDGNTTALSEPMPFDVKVLRKGAMEGAQPDKVVAFWQQLQSLYRDFSNTQMKLKKSLKHMKTKRQQEEHFISYPFHTLGINYG